MHRILFVLLLALGSIMLSHAQEADDFLSDFLAVQQGEEIYLRWTIKSGNTCDGTIIQRSTDSIYFEQIGEISGICGSPNQSITYDFTDMQPEKNSINYYRLELGQYGYTSKVAIDFIILNEDGYSLQPNPVSTRSKLVFENPDNNEVEFCLIDIQGRMAMNMFTTSNQFWIDASMIQSGTYIFKLMTEQKLLTKGKLVVL